MRKQNTFLFNVANYDFKITPQRLIFSQPMTGSYLLELQKGCQSIKVLPEVAQYQSNKAYVYHKTEPVIIKAFKEKHMGFLWSLYRNVQDKIEFVDSFKLDLNARFNAYLEDLRSLTFEVSQFVRKFQNGSSFSENWKSIKSQLRSIKTKETLKNFSGSIVFEYIIQIKCQIDYLLQQDMYKKRVLTKGSLSSEGSSISLNSLAQVNKAKIQSKKSPKDKESTHNQESYSKSTPLIQNEQIKLPQHLRSTHKQGIMIMPQLQPKQMIALSDIMQASNESSIPNAGERTDRKPSEQSWSPEAQVRSFKKTNTFHFGHNTPEKDEFRRNNSLKAINIGSKIEDQQEGEIQQLPVQEEEIKYENDEFTTTSTILKFQSKIDEKGHQTKKFMAILLIIGVYLCLGGILGPNMLKQLRKRPVLYKSKGLIKKNALNWDIFDRHA